MKNIVIGQMGKDGIVRTLEEGVYYDPVTDEIFEWDVYETKEGVRVMAYLLSFGDGQPTVGIPANPIVHLGDL